MGMEEKKCPLCDDGKAIKILEDQLELNHQKLKNFKLITKNTELEFKESQRQEMIEIYERSLRLMESLMESLMGKI